MADSLYQRLSLATLNRGAAIELVDQALDRVTENIADPNTDAKTTRTVTLKIKVTPTEDRATATVIVVAEVKMAPDRGVASVIHYGRGIDGKAAAFELAAAQGGLFERDDEQPVNVVRPLSVVNTASKEGGK